MTHVDVTHVDAALSDAALSDAALSDAALSDAALIEEIERLRKEKNAVILGHYYQDPDIQDVADFVGDSLDLSRKAAATDADVIVFCGVRFMAEVAKIVNPHKTVVLPDWDAGCSLMEGCPAEEFRAFREKHPDHMAITYINCSAEVKALSDIIVTSSNAEKIVNQLPADQPIIFAPDRHLGAWLNRKTGRDMLLWQASCEVHDKFSEEGLDALKTAHPEAKVAAHPECPHSVLARADHVGSTRSLLDYVTHDPAQTFIIATEEHILHQMTKAVPHKTFLVAPGNDGTCKCASCPHMGLNTLAKLHRCLATLEPRIEIDEDLRVRALKPLERMLEMST